MSNKQIIENLPEKTSELLAEAQHKLKEREAQLQKFAASSLSSGLRLYDHQKEAKIATNKEHQELLQETAIKIGDIRQELTNEMKKGISESQQSNFGLGTGNINSSQDEAN